MKAAEITHTNTTPKAINLREADRTLSSAVELFINWILSGMSLQAKASKLVRSRAVRARASYPPNDKLTGGDGAQRNPRPVQRLVSRCLFFNGYIVESLVVWIINNAEFNTA